MESRPRVVPILTWSDKMIELLGWCSLALIWLLAIYNFTVLPETIPTHFNASGEIDGYGHKLTLFILPLIITFMFIVLSYLNKRPYLFNYPGAITQENALRQYANATKMMRVLKLMIGIVFVIIMLIAWTIPQANEVRPGIWFMPVALTLIVLPVAFFIVRSFRLK